MGGNDFKEHWEYRNALEKRICDALAKRGHRAPVFTMEPDGYFKTGRPRYLWTVDTADGVPLGSRTAMKLTSRKGFTYYVISRDY